MKVTVHNVLINRDMVLKVPKQVWPWELPVLEAKFGATLQRKDSERIELSELPDAGVEQERLLLAHGSDAGRGGTNVPFVTQVYGPGSRGIKALEKAIKASARKPKTTKKAAAKPKPEAASDETDPLSL